MITATILKVMYNNREFYVIAKSFFAKNSIVHLDCNTKIEFDSKEVNYCLTEIKDSKPNKFIGCTQTISRGTQTMWVFTKTSSYSPAINEYKRDRIVILEEVYNFETITY